MVAFEFEVAVLVADDLEVLVRVVEDRRRSADQAQRRIREGVAREERLHLVAQQTGLEVGDFVWTGGDCHIYDNPVEQVRLQLEREPFAPPTLRITRKPDTIFDYRYDDFVIEDYQHHPAIRGAVAV